MIFIQRINMQEPDQKHINEQDISAIVKKILQIKNYHGKVIIAIRNSRITDIETRRNIKKNDI
jgi:hypothetical protein